MANRIQIERQKRIAICTAGSQERLVTTIMSDYDQTDIDLFPEQVGMSPMEYHQWLIDQWEKYRDDDPLCVLADCIDDAGWDLMDDISSHHLAVYVDGELVMDAWEGGA